MTELIPLALEVLAEQEAKVEQQSIQLTQEVLGMQPYVLVKMTGVDESDPEAFRVTFEYGGGLDKESAFELLKAIVDDSEEV